MTKIKVHNIKDQPPVPRKTKVTTSIAENVIRVNMLKRRRDAASRKLDAASRSRQLGTVSKVRKLTTVSSKAEGLAVEEFVRVVEWLQNLVDGQVHPILSYHAEGALMGLSSLIETLGQVLEADTPDCNCCN